MKVRLITHLASPSSSHEPGEVWEVTDEEGARMVSAGVALAISAGSSQVAENPEAKAKPAKREKR